ncbi:MAG: carboxyl transferase domain-containing protein [Rhodocyclaceae bacterium]
MPDNPNKPYDIKELIAKTVDEGDFFERSRSSYEEHRDRLRPHVPRRWASSPANRWCWQAASTSKSSIKGARASCVSATPSTSRW